LSWAETRGLGEDRTCGETKMGILRVAMCRLGIVGELLSFFWQNKRWWVLPMVVVLVMLGLLLVLVQSPAVAPFIYTLF
jgi:Family of unknown function (DUF5989)